MRAFPKGSSLIEAMVVVFIVSFGLTSVYLVLGRGQTLATATSNRIQAINLAREGVEIVSNIRDTNWVKFTSDMASCWKVKDYNKTCVGLGDTTNNYGRLLWFGGGAPANFTPYLSGNLWYLRDLGAFSSGIYFDASGLPYQTGAVAEAAGIEMKPCGKADPYSCRSMFNRTIRLGHSGSHVTQGAPAWCGTWTHTEIFGTGCLDVTSTVTWYDQSEGGPRTVQLQTTLTNWKVDL